MKNIFLALMIAGLGSVAAAQEEFQQCSLEQIQMLDNATGEGSELVDSVLHLELPDFSCQVKQVFHVFPADCGRFTFVEFNFLVEVGGQALTATVFDGGISCMGVKKSVLQSVQVQTVQD